jgi:hypothetical protein
VPQPSAYEIELGTEKLRVINPQVLIKNQQTFLTQGVEKVALI